jgi:hypothetical protein
VLPSTGGTRLTPWLARHALDEWLLSIEESGEVVGALIYGSPSMELEFDDRTLSHLQVVVGSKLRRGESFFFSWKENQSTSDRRSSVWLSPGIPLMFKFSGGRAPRMNTEWLRLLEETANSGRGLLLLPEPPEPQGEERARVKTTTPRQPAAQARR